jgi:hypothetical protein
LTATDLVIDAAEHGCKTSLGWSVAHLSDTRMESLIGTNQRGGTIFGRVGANIGPNNLSDLHVPLSDCEIFL